MNPHPILLIILDGFGCRSERAHNAIAQANKPNWQKLWSTNPHTLIHASESAVGLPSGQMGNSEVGHLNIGAGRVVYQEYTRIDHAIETGYFFTNHTLKQACAVARDQGKTMHILGLLSDGGVHSHERHIHAMLEMARREGVQRVSISVGCIGCSVPARRCWTREYIRKRLYCSWSLIFKCFQV